MLGESAVTCITALYAKRMKANQTKPKDWDVFFLLVIEQYI